jgi:hypothetical protein
MPNRRTLNVRPKLLKNSHPLIFVRDYAEAINSSCLTAAAAYASAALM